MRVAEGSLGRVFVLRLEDGDRIPDCIEQFAAEKGIEGGLCALLGGIGSGTVVAGPKSSGSGPVEPILQRISDVHEAAAIGTMGGVHIDCSVAEVCVDEANRIVSTPAYMLGPGIKDVALGIENLVERVLSLC